MTNVWKYNSEYGNRVKHSFYRITDKFSICGVGMPWYSSSDWQSDKEGLDKRPECKRCVNLLNKNKENPEY